LKTGEDYPREYQLLLKDHGGGNAVEKEESLLRETRVIDSQSGWGKKKKKKKKKKKQPREGEKRRNFQGGISTAKNGQIRIEQGSRSNLYGYDYW